MKFSHKWNPHVILHLFQNILCGEESYTSAPQESLLVVLRVLCVFKDRTQALLLAKPVLSSLSISLSL